MPIRRAALLLLGLVACTKKEVPASFAGHFQRPVKGLLGIVSSPAELIVTTKGLSARNLSAIPTIGVETTGGLLAQKGRVGTDNEVSIFFDRVECDGPNSCSFETKECKGTLSKDLSKEPSGNLIVIANGSCAPISGEWLTEENAKKVASITLPSLPSMPALPQPPQMPSIPSFAMPAPTGAK